MPTPAEKRALVFFSSVLTLGFGVRATTALRAAPPPPGAQASAELHRQIVAVDSADSVQRLAGKRHRSKRPRSVGVSSRGAADLPLSDSAPSTSRKRRPARLASVGQPRDLGAAPGGPVDVDRAQEWEILALPKIGPALAHRIVANRDSLGPFGSLDELRRVKGVGAALAEAIAPYVTFSQQPRQSQEKEGDGTAAPRRNRRRARPPPSP